MSYVNARVKNMQQNKPSKNRQAEYQLMHDLVFKYKNDAMITKLLNNNNYLALVADDQGIYLLEKMVDSFILQSTIGNNTFYMALVIAQFSNYNDNSSVRQRISEKLATAWDKINKSSECTKDQKNKITIQFKELVHIAPNINYGSLKNILTPVHPSPVVFKEYEQVELKESSNDDEEIKQDVNIMTIDTDSCKFMEDAISIKKVNNQYIATVYITDIDDLVNGNVFSDELMSNGIDEKTERPLSLFNIERRTYLNERASLTRGEPRKVVAYEFTFDKNFNFLSFDAKSMVIKVNKNYKYEDINMILHNSKHTDHDEIKMLTAFAHHFDLQRELTKKMNRHHYRPELIKEISDKLREKGINYVHTFLDISSFYNSGLTAEQISNKFPKYKVDDIKEVYSTIKAKGTSYIVKFKEIGETINASEMSIRTTPGDKIASMWSDLTNTVVSNYFNEYNLPFIYRVDDFKEKEEMIAFVENEFKYDDIKKEKILDTMGHIYADAYASFSANNVGKGKEAKAAYGCVTNPVRDYDALVNQHIFKKLYIDNMMCDFKTKREFEHNLTYIADYMNEIRRIRKRKN